MTDYALGCFNVASTPVLEVATLVLVGIVHFREEGHAHAERRNTKVSPVIQMFLLVVRHVIKC